MNFRIDFLKKQWKNSNPKFKRIKCSWWVWKEAFLIRVLHSQTSVFFEISFSHFPTNPPPLDFQNFPSANYHVKFKNFWRKLDQNLNRIFSKISVLNSVQKSWISSLKRFQFSIVVETSAQITWIGCWISSDQKFWSKGSLKNLIKNKFKILNQFFSKILVLNSDQSSVQKFWRISSCPQFWSKSWIGFNSQFWSKFWSHPCSNCGSNDSNQLWSKVQLFIFVLSSLKDQFQIFEKTELNRSLFRLWFKVLKIFLFSDFWKVSEKSLVLNSFKEPFAQSLELILIQIVIKFLNLLLNQFRSRVWSKSWIDLSS